MNNNVSRMNVKRTLKWERKPEKLFKIKSKKLNKYEILKRTLNLKTMQINAKYTNKIWSCKGKLKCKEKKKTESPNKSCIRICTNKQRKEMKWWEKRKRRIRRLYSFKNRFYKIKSKREIRLCGVSRKVISLNQWVWR